MVCKYFVLFCRLSFHYLVSVLGSLKYLNFNDLFFALVACALGTVSEKPVLNSRSCRFTPMFSSKSFIVLTLMLRSCTSEFLESSACNSEPH